MKLLYLLLLPCLLLAQTTPPPPGPLYHDYTVADSLLYLLKRGDTLEIRNTENNAVIAVKTGIRAVAKGRTGMYALTSTGTFITLPGNKNPMPEKPFTLGYPLLLDKDDNPLTLTNKGIYHKDSLYVPDKKLVRSTHSYANDNGAFHYPNIIFLDSEQHLWLGYEQGEWGGGYFIFDLNTKQFVSLDENTPVDSAGGKKRYKYPVVYIRNPRGIAEDANSTLLFSESLYHSSVSGALRLVPKVNNGLYEQFISLKDILDYDHKNEKRPQLTEYLGPVAYNPYNKSFYYYSQLGFFRITKNNSTYAKELLFNPELLFTYGQAHALGYVMNLEKFDFVAENKLVFLTTENGIGYYNGKEVVYYK